MDNKLLANAPTNSDHRKMVLGAILVVTLLLALGLLAKINGWVLIGITVLASTAFAMLVWPPGADERAATIWWNALSISERENWLNQGETEKRLDAWIAFKNSQDRK